jgi:hypothetical protein
MKWIHVAVEPSSAPEILSSEEQDDIRLETSDEIINEQKVNSLFKDETLIPYLEL